MKNLNLYRTFIQDYDTIFLNKYDIIKVNIYLHALGLHGALLVDYKGNNELIYETVMSMIRINDGYENEPFAGEILDVIEKCHNWKDEQNFYIELERILGDDCE